MRLAGGALMTVMLYLLGCLIASRQKAAVRNLYGVIKLLKYIESRIITGGSSIGDILAGYEDEALEKSGFLPLLRADGMHSIDKCASVLGLSQQAVAELTWLSGRFGTLCTSAQTAEIRQATEALEAEYTALSGRLPAEQRVTRAVWGLAGALLALLLV